MIRVSEVHGKVLPDSILQHSHIPWPGYRVRKLPNNVKTILVGKPFIVGLDDRISTLKKRGSQRMQSVAAIHHLRTLQMLEGIDRFHLSEVILKPSNAAVWLAILQIFKEIGNLILADRAVPHRIALNQRDLDLIEP